MESFLDAFFTDRLQKTGLYGAAFTMVKDGEILLAKGYGQRDPIDQLPLAINETVLRVASVAKAFTATAVMQLCERGLIDLDADVTQYLGGLTLEGDQSVPLTIGHLLSHTEGFQERNIGIVATNEADLLTLEQFFARRAPRRVLPPGQMLTYGNWASGLLGYIVERVTGLSFAAYVAANIFEPLGMTSSTFEQPAPPELVARRIRECTQSKAGFADAPEIFAQMAPAGGMHAGLLDMARYLIAMVGDGSAGGGRILRPETVRAMHARRFVSHPGMPGITYGFFEEFRGGRRVLRRDGDSTTAWSRIYLLPEQQIGLFFTVAGDEETRLALSDELFEHLFGAGELRPPATAVDLECYAGTYRYLQYNRETFTKLQSLLVGQVKVQVKDDNRLSVTALTAGDLYGGFEGTTEWAPAGVDLFRRVDSDAQIAFRRDPQGRVVNLFSSMRYQGAFERLRWWETAPFNLVLFALCVVLSLTAAIGFGIRPLFGGTWDGPTLAMGLYGLLAAGFCLLLIPAIFLIGNVGGLFPSYGFGINRWIRTTLSLPLVTTALTAGLVYETWAVWQGGLWTMGARTLYSVLTLGALALVWWLRQWNLLGYRW